MMNSMPLRRPADGEVSELRGRRRRPPDRRRMGMVVDGTLPSATVTGLSKRMLYSWAQQILM
jgi:hypothetical protein